MENSKKNLKLGLFIFIVLSIVFPFIDNNSFLYEVNSYCDVQIFYDIGKALTNGLVLYEDIVDFKGPYIFFIGSVSYLLFKNYLFFYILNFLSAFLYVFFSYKSFSKYLYKKIHRYLFLFWLIVSLAYVHHIGNIEFMLMGVISFFIYWIINNGFNKNNKCTFFFFGIIAGFLLLSKLNHILGFSVIGLIYCINKLRLKEFRILLKELIFFFLGLLLSLTPFLIYGIINDNIFYLISEYIRIVTAYAGSMIIVDRGIYNVFFIFVFLILFLILEKKLSISTKVLLLTFFSFLGLAVFLTGRFYNYYAYIFVPFFPIELICFIKIFDKKIISSNISIFIGCFVQISLICLSFLFISSAINIKGFHNKEEDFYAYKFYQDYKDEVTDESIILGLFHLESIITYYFDNQPYYKYFITLNASYEIWEDVYLEYQELIKSKEADYLVVMIDKAGRIKIGADLANSNLNYVQEVSKDILENYELDNTYSTDYFDYCIYVPKQ